MDERCWALTEKEKQTLRLIVRGHDAKSIARSLDLSVHTINERLREARRKMAVSSSREAARMLLAAEGDPLSLTPEKLGNNAIGEAPAGTPADEEPGPRTRRPWIIVGVLIMTFVLALLALTEMPSFTSAPPQPATTGTEAPSAEVVSAGRDFLVLLDQSRWEESYQRTGTAFQKLNTGAVWASISDKVRKPLGAAVSRTFLSQENLPAPPAGYEVVKFRTRFGSGAEMVETVTLERENGRWLVVGVTVG